MTRKVLQKEYMSSDKNIKFLPAPQTALVIPAQAGTQYSEPWRLISDGAAYWVARSRPGDDSGARSTWRNYSAWPSMIGPNSCQFSPVNRIIWTCSIG